MSLSIKQLEINKRKDVICEAFRRRHESLEMRFRVKFNIAQIRYQQIWGA